MRGRLHLAQKIVAYKHADAEEADMGARTVAVFNHNCGLRFALEQAEPRLAQVLDRRPIPRTDDGMIRHNIHTFANIPRLHGTMAQVPICSGKGAKRLF